MSKVKSTVTITIDGKGVECPAGSTLLEVILNSGFKIATACGGNGTCHLCRVTVVEGKQNTCPPSPKEARILGNILVDAGIRLSCQIKISQPFAIRLPKYESPQQRRRRKQRAKLKPQG